MVHSGRRGPTTEKQLISELRDRLHCPSSKDNTPVTYEKNLEKDGRKRIGKTLTLNEVIERDDGDGT
jgi:hypothetical protein